jgi:hypothetical protein
VTIRKDATIIVGTRNKISFGYSPPIFASDIRLRDSYPIFASRGGQLNGTSKCIVAPSL